jgi:hypothetical protein
MRYRLSELLSQKLIASNKYTVAFQELEQATYKLDQNSIFSSDQHIVVINNSKIVPDKKGP